MTEQHGNHVHGDVHGIVIQAETVHGGIHVHPPRSGPVAVVTAVVPAGEVFVGRADEVEHLLASVAPGGSEAPVIVTAVAGMGGVGKTALAVHVAATAHSWGRFPGGAFVVDLQGYRPGGGVRPETVFGPLLRSLGVPGEEVPADPAEQGTVYDQVMRGLDRRGQAVLLVLDNASSADQVRGLVPTGIHRTIVTTRDTLDLPGARRLELDVLTEADALALLVEAVAEFSPGDTRAHGDGAARLVRVCGLLPLAVRIAAGLLSDEPDLTCDLLAAQLDEATIEAFARGETAVAAVFALSVDRMRARAPEAVRLLRLVAISPGLDISTEAAATFDATSTAVVLTRLRALRQAHLLGHVDGRWRLHDLIRRYAVALEPPPDDATSALLNLLRHYNTTAFAASIKLVDTDHRDDSPFIGRAEALVWLDAEHGNLVAAVAATADLGAPQLTRFMAEAVLPYLRVRHHVADRVMVARYARAAADHLDDPPLVAQACGEFGAALCAARRFTEAEGLQREAIDRYHRADRPFDEAAEWKRLGGTLQEARRFADAEAAFRRALDLYGKRRPRFFGKHDPETAAARDVGRASVLKDLGSVLYDLGRLEEAITVLRRSVALFGELNRAQDEGSSWSALGLALCEAGKHDEALAAHERARGLLTEAPDHQDEAMAWNNLGSALQKAKRPAEAVTAHQRAVELYRDSGDPVRRAKAWDNLGLALQDAGRHGEAVTVHRVARDLFEEGGDDFRQAMSCNNLGYALEEGGLPDEAVASHRQALDLYRATGDRGREGRAWIALGAAWQLAGDDAQGARCLEIAVTDFMDCLSQVDIAYVAACVEFARRRLG